MSETQVQVTHADSIDSQDPNISTKGKKAKNRRPANTAFRQQRLKAWQPILTPKTVLPLFFVIGIIFAPIGGALLYASAIVKQIEIDYSTCGVDAPQGEANYAPIPGDRVKWSFKSEAEGGNQATWFRQNIDYTFNQPNFKQPIIYNTTQCSLTFSIPEQMDPPVFFYYRLTNFYQNHRRYVKSFQSDQLKGTAVDNSTIAGSTCDPIKLDPVSGKPYYPCGLIANSLFNDTFYNPVLQNVASEDGHDVANVTYVMSNNSGISWDSDKDLYGSTQYKTDQIVPPPNWQIRWPNGYTDDNPPPNLAEDEAFQVWMRTAGLPTFSKLAQRNDNDPMRVGTYQLFINLNFPVNEYGGTKSIIISTRTVMGGKNPFLGIAYIVVGGLCVVLGVVFTVAHLVKPRKLGDHTYLSWNNEQTSTATATGRDAGLSS